MTDKSARAEAERRWPRGWNVEEGTFRDGTVNGFILGAEWARKAVLAEVRARIEAIPSTPWFKADALDAIDARAVLDRARNGGEQS